jgi:uncharacterized membrane protein
LAVLQIRAIPRGVTVVCALPPHPFKASSIQLLQVEGVYRYSQLVFYFILFRRNFHMNTRLIASSALASVLALGLISGAQAAADEKMPAKEAKEKCFGIAKAGANDCSNLSGSHSCAGQSKADMDPGEWKFVAKGTCAKMGGKTAGEAKGEVKK